LGGRSSTSVPTASHAFRPAAADLQPAPLSGIVIDNISDNDNDNEAITNPHRPLRRSPSAAAVAEARAAAAAIRSTDKSVPTALGRRRGCHPAPINLWNPSNSTPRVKNPRRHHQTGRQRRRRRSSTPPPPSIQLRHPALGGTEDADPDPDASSPHDPVSGGSYPLLTLPELRQTRHAADSQRSSFQGPDDRRASLPRSVRALENATPSGHTTPVPLPHPTDADADRGSDRTVRRLDKGKGIAMAPSTEQQRNSRSFSQDLERGPDPVGQRLSTLSAGDAIGSALSSTNSSIMGEDIHADGDEWGPQHPCYPHFNPHVALDSPEFTSTRIIRIKRDWMLQGDLAPTFSNLYPEILDPAGLPEQEFRRIIDKLNSELVPIFNPYSLRNVLDGVLGVVTGWLWDDFGLTSTKSRLNKLERWIEEWNDQTRRIATSGDGAVAPKLISLRQTGYMTVGIRTDARHIEETIY
jgi:hypothetical protein